MARKEMVKTYCLMCGTRCPVVCTVEDGRLTRVVPDKEHPLGGTFCVKGAAAPEFVYDRSRLCYPMRRSKPKTEADPGWVRITWDEAFDTIAKKLLELRSRLGPESVVFYRPALGGSASADYQPWLQRLACAFGTPNYAKTTHICNWHKDVGSRYTYGVGIPEPDYENSGTILVWGTNPSNTDVRHAVGIERALKKGATLIVVDPKRIPLTAKAAEHLYVRPGTDLPLVLGLINQVLLNGFFDREFVLRWTNAPFLVRADTGRLLREREIAKGEKGSGYVAWDESRGRPLVYDPAKVSYEESVEPLLDGEVTVLVDGGKQIACSTVFRALGRIAAEFTPERVSEITSVPNRSIVNAARLMASSRPLSYYTYNGIEQHTDAMQINRAICILYGLLGDFDRKGGNVIFPDLPVNPVSGFNFLSQDVVKKRLGGRERPLGPGGSFVKDAAVQAYDIYDAILTAKPYPVRGFVSFGGNLVVSNGDSKRGVAAMRQLEFYAHVDLYENPTSRFADILLPAASSWEAECVGKWEVRNLGHLQMRRRVIEPQFERRGDIEIIFELAVRLGLADKFFEGDMEAGFNYMMKPLGKTVSDLRSLGSGFTVPLETSYLRYRQVDPATGAPVGFETPTRLLEIYSKTFEDFGQNPLPRYEAPERRVDRNAYPFLLTAFKPVQFTHGSYRSIPALRRQFPEPLALVNPRTAQQMNVSDREWVKIETSNGSVRARISIDDGVVGGAVVAQEGWWQACAPLGLPGYDPFESDGSNLNLIIDNKMTDKISGSVAMRGVPCRVVGD